MIAFTSRRICGDIVAAHNYLRRSGYDCIRGCWMKHRSFARIERLPSGKISVKEGVIA